VRAASRLLGECAGVARRRATREGGFEQLEERMLLSPVAVGSEFRVNTFTNGPQQTFFQTPEAVAVNPGTGGFIVTWSSQNQVPGQGWDVYAQRYNAAGVPQGNEFLVNTTTSDDQEYSSVAMDANGDFIITWSGHQSGHWQIYAQRYNAAGVAQGPEMLVNSATASDQMFSTVAMDDQGDFVIAWSGHQSGNWAVYARQFNHNGNAQGGAFQVSFPTPGADQEFSDVAMNRNGDFVITWSGHQSNHWSVYAQEFGIGGNPRGGIFQVNTTTSDDREYSTAAMDAVGNFVITWSSHNQDGSGWGVYARQYSAPGTPLTGEFQVNTYTKDDQEYASVAMNGGGRFVITWSSHNQDGNGWGVYAQAYNPQAQPQGGEFQVNSYTKDDQEFSSAAMSDSGQLVMAWSSNNQDGDNWGVYGQRYSSAGFTVTPTALTTTEAGGTASYSVMLDQQPTASVTINLSSSAPSQGTLSQSSLTFTLSNWNVAQSVTVTGLDDHIVNGDQTYQITGTASSGDGNFNGLAMPAVTVTNKENDVAGLTVTGSSFLVSEDNSLLRVDALTGAVLATYPTGVSNDGFTAGPDGSLYVSDYGNSRILHFDATGAFLSSFTAAQLVSPQDLAFGPDGNLYVTDTNGPNKGAVYKFSPAGSFLGTFIAPGSGGLSNAKAIVWGPDGNAYVSSYFNSEVIRYNGTTGAFLNVFATGSGGFEDLTFGPDGNLYVASYGDGAVYHYRGSDGAPLGAFISGIATPYGLRFDPAGNLIVSSRSTGQVQIYGGTTGAYRGTLVAGLNNPGYMSAPTSLVTSESGTSADFSVVLNSQPTADVTVMLTSTMTGQGKWSQSALTFTPASWNLAQTVTVTGLDDHVVNGDQT
jgi:sugar lactone lactonase YvrE